MDFSNHFDPDTLNLLQEVYDEACRYISLSDGKLSPKVCDEIARRIVAHAITGERELSKLKAYALAGLNRRSRSDAGVSLAGAL